MLASELYAISQGKTCQGPERCHWCGSPCERVWIHDDLPSIPFLKNPNMARCPGNGYICVGCWLFRRRRVTVFFLDGKFKDGQCPMDHSWLLTEEKATAIRPQDRGLLQEVLRKPPRRFALAIKNGKAEQTFLHTMQVNDPQFEIKAEDPLVFTCDNSPLTYSIYELQDALEHGAAGKEPGVRALVGMIDPSKLDEVPQKKQNRSGPPVSAKVNSEERITKGPKAIVRASGL